MKLSDCSQACAIRRARFFAVAIVAMSACGFAVGLCGAQETPTTATQMFVGEKTDWHGFDRYDFFLDEETLAIKPADQKGDVNGQRRCIVVVPKMAVAGNPWSWRGCYWDHEPQTEIELLKRGFHIAYITANATLRPDKKWDAWYAFLEKHGLSKKPAFIGMSRGGEFAYTWATSHPDKVSCIYADNPGGNGQIFANLSELARNDVPVLQVCGSIDPILGRFGLPFENIYRQFGGRISMIIKEGAGHHPHSLRDPKPIADFITSSVQATTSAPPAFVGRNAVRTSFYSTGNSYREIATEQNRVTCRGPLFTECYERYSFDLEGVEGSIDIICPKAAAPGNPWVFRAGYADRDAVVDLALLGKGFHIVTGPVPYNADGPLLPHWNAVYEHFVTNGFSSKPVMEGTGGAAGEVYGWASENPDKVSCIYAENPVLRSRMVQSQPLQNLAPLAKAGVPIMHVCGSLDPWLKDNSHVAVDAYQKLGGKITLILKQDVGHYPLAPADPKPVVEFITSNTDNGLSRKPVTVGSIQGPVLMAGSAKVSITPEDAKQPVHDKVHARALVLELNGQRVAFVSVDLGIYTSEKLVAACKEKFGISHLVLSSSHTHSDPGRAHSAFYEEQILRAVESAVANMFPARISAGHRAFPQLGFNRLIVRDDGHARESWFSDDHYTSENPERIPFGPVDPEVGVIKIEDTNGQPRAIIMNYACHADVVCQNYAVSADYPGVACRKVEEAFGTNCNCLFVQGAAGNVESLIISSRRAGPDDPFQTDYTTIERVGELLAYETVKLANSLPPKASQETTLCYRNDALQFTGRFDKKAAFDIHISTIVINDDIVIATVPGEPFVQLQLDWKKKVSMAHPFVFGYTWYQGTWPNYIPDITSAARGGYGADQEGPTMMEVGSGEAIMNKHLENSLRLTGLMREEPGPVGFKAGMRWQIAPVPPKQ